MASAASSQRSVLSLEALQMAHLLAVINVQKHHSIPPEAVCTGSTHILTCGHAMSYPDKRNMPCTLACRKQCIGRADAKKRGKETKMSYEQECAHPHLQTHDVEEYPVCPDCWLKQCLIRLYYFYVDSRFPGGSFEFTSQEFVFNFVPVYLYPEIVEVTRKVKGKVHAWSGPSTCLLNYHYDIHAMVGFAARLFVNTKEQEIPAVVQPDQPCFATIIRGPEGSIHEVKLVPVDRDTGKRKVTFDESVRVRFIPVPTTKKTLNDEAMDRKKANATSAVPFALAMRAKAYRQCL